MRNNHTLTSIGIVIFILGLVWLLSTVILNNTPLLNNLPNDTTTNGLPIKLYYYNPNLDQGPGGAQCSSRGLVPVERVIPRTTTPIQDSIKLLLRGEITNEEKARGIVSDFPLPGVTLQSASLSNDILTLVFDDPENKTSGGACRAGILWKEVEAVGKQFPGVKTVRFLPADLFQS